MMAIVKPVMATTRWPWVVLAVLLVGVWKKDRMVSWERRPGVRFPESLAAAGLALVLIVSYRLGAAVPDGNSLVWPLVAFVLMAVGLVVRYQAIRALDGAASNQTRQRWFNGDLKTWPGQAVVSTGPYRFVRHPGYAGSFAILVGLAFMTALWPVCLVVLVILCVMFRRRVLVEEAINRTNIAGYEDYLVTQRWRIVPGIW